MVYAVRMSDKNENDWLPETDVEMTFSKDGKEINVRFTSETAFTVASFILELETYLHEISKASVQMSEHGVGRH